MKRPSLRRVNLEGVPRGVFKARSWDAKNEELTAAKIVKAVLGMNGRASRWHIVVPGPSGIRIHQKFLTSPCLLRFYKDKEVQPVRILACWANITRQYAQLLVEREDSYWEVFAEDE